MERELDAQAWATETLLRELPWMRGLARALLRAGDGAAAEDVAQEAAAAAWGAWSGGAPPDRPRGWLAGTVRRMVARVRRSDGRRARREAQAAPPEAIESASSAVERLQRHRQVVEALDALEPLLRETLLLRFYEEMAPRRIARQLGVPVETVKTRLKRGLEKLRGRLIGGLARESSVAGGAFDRERAEQRLRGFLLPLAAAPVAGTATTAAAALLLGLLAVGGWIVGESRDGATDRPLLAARSREAGRDELEPLSGESADAVLAPTAERRDAATPRIESPQLAATARLRGVVVDAAGQPAAGARVAIDRLDGDVDSVNLGLELEGAPRTRRVGEAVADAAGHFELPVVAHRPLALHAERTHESGGDSGDESGDQRAWLEPCFGDEEVRVQLERTTTLRVRVVDGVTLEPLPEVAVVAERQGDRRRENCRSVADASGVAQLRGLLPGKFTLAAATRARRGHGTVTVVAATSAGATIEHQLRLEPCGALHGRVVAAADGRPVAGASIAGDFFHRRDVVRSGGDGRFELPAFTNGQITVRAPGFGTRQWHDLASSRDEGEREFLLLAARRAIGRVIDDAGRPLEGVRVVAFAHREEANFGATDVVATDSDDEGRFALADLAPEFEHALALSCPGFAQRVVLFPASELGAAEVDLGALELHAPGLLAGLVVGSDGEPVRGRRIALSGIDGEWAERQPARAVALPRVLRSYAVERSTVSDSRGRFHLDDLPSGAWRIEVIDASPVVIVHGARAVPERPGAAGATLRVDLTAGERRNDLRLRLEPLRTLRGECVDRDGQLIPRAGVQVGMAGPGRSAWFISAQAIDGTFEIADLVPGDLKLRFRKWCDEPELLPVTLDAVPAGTRDLRVVLEAGRRVKGRVATAAGVPVARVPVVACSGERWFEPTLTDEEGAFSLLVPAGETVELEAREAVDHLSLDDVVAALEVVAPKVMARARAAVGEGEVELRWTGELPARPPR